MRPCPAGREFKRDLRTSDGRERPKASGVTIGHRLKLARTRSASDQAPRRDEQKTLAAALSLANEAARRPLSGAARTAGGLIGDW
jgi:hypothetical protein